jgi:hypothetical protein
MLLAVSSISASPVIRQGSGANAAAIQPAIDLFRADLGGANNGVGNSFTTGRREINWDGVPDNFAAPNEMPRDFFNVNSPRGAVFSSPCSSQVQVSATQGSGTAVRFGNIDPSYQTNFTTFSPGRLFSVQSTANVVNQFPCNTIIVEFFVPGTNIPATVSGFGAVATDVDIGGRSLIRCFTTNGGQTDQGFQVASNGLSFVGISFNAGERISKCFINSGNQRLASGNIDAAGIDLVAMDDFIYGEPRAAQYHSSDFDGDGVSDTAVFRPSTGNWFILNSGSNTFRIETWGQNGDIPVDGDFDGDSLADLAIYRPSSGVWFFQRSSNGTTLGAQFGQAGDKPVAADYDKDGKTDIAIFGPSNGTWNILRSSDNFNSFFGFPFGQNGDIPIGADSNQP